jgi:4-amino-4-deoxy-L-arabinose transferase-like glycosyltransferase
LPEAEREVFLKNTTNQPAAARTVSRHFLLVVAVLFIAAFNIASTFPGDAQYKWGADEGTYYRQAREIRTYGCPGYRLAAERFIEDEAAHIFPSPLRILPLALDALALSVVNSIAALSVVSLICFVLLGLLSYYYVKDIWERNVAVIVVVLLAFSPLGGAMARRALVDSMTYLASGFSLLSFLAYVVRRNSGRLRVFSFSLFLLQMTRESGVLLYPFFFAVLVYLHYRRHPEITLRAVFLCFAVPLGATLIAYEALFGAGTLYRMMHVIYFDNLLKPSWYVVNFSSGPWYRYLVDFMLLSPFSILLAYLYTGHCLYRREFDAQTGVLFAFFAYTILVFAFLQMNVRYVIFLDLVIRIIEALGLLAFASAFIKDRRKRTIVIAAAVALLAIMDVGSFTNYFVSNNIYDPVSYQLLHVEKFIPALTPPFH